MNATRTLRPFYLAVFLPLILLLLPGCQTTGDGIHDSNRAALQQSIGAETPGDYWVGRRHYKEQYYYWGYVRRPGKPWSTAQLVMLNEQRTLAPDKVAGKIGVDNNHEYRLYGSFSGEKVYEPSSNSFYPEFILQRYELVNQSPPPIFGPSEKKPGRETFYY